MPTSLYVERDVTYHHLTRLLRGSCLRAEWDDLAHRQAVLDRNWTQAIDGIRSEGYDFVSPSPVTLYCHPRTKEVVYADLRGPGDPWSSWIDAHGTRLLGVQPDTHLVRLRTTYARWAEGPLPHIVPDLLPAPTTTDDVALQRLRHQNRALREALDWGLAQGPNDAALARGLIPGDDTVDFRLRGVFRKQDFRVLVSKQAPAEGSKILTSDGVIE